MSLVACGTHSKMGSNATHNKGGHHPKASPSPSVTPSPSMTPSPSPTPTATPSTAVTGNLIRIQGKDLPQMDLEDGDEGVIEAGSKSALKRALLLQLVQCDSPKLVNLQRSDWDFAGKKVARARYCNQTIQWFLTKLDQVKNLNELYTSASKELEWYRSVGRPQTKDVLFTGYYFPTYLAKKKPDSKYKWPIYSMPKDLVLVHENGETVWRRRTASGAYVPYYSRAQIEGGAIRGAGYEIAYLDNPVDPYLLQVEGSGSVIVQNEDGTQTKLITNYSGKNGHPYTSLGKVMRAANVPEEYLNAQGMKRYFALYPEKWPSLSYQNKSYVFFELAKEGPYGANGVLLTPKHSLAVDDAEFPLGAMTLIQTERAGQIEGDQVSTWKPFIQFALTQDTGGAIKSPGRVDIYWGDTHYAEVNAGQLTKTGNLYFALVPEVK